MAYITKRQDGEKTSYTVRFRDQHGQWREKSAGPLRKHAEALLSRVVEEVNAGTYGAKEKEDPTFGAFAEEFLKIKAAEVKPSTLVSYEGAVRRHLNPYLGDLRLSEITPARVQGLLVFLGEDGVSPASIGKIYRTFKVIIRRALALELINRDPTTAIKPPRTPDKEMGYLNAEEVSRVLSASEEEPALHAMVSIAVFSGLRVGEIMALRWQDIDFETGVIRVVRSYTRRHGYSDPKTYAGRRAVPVIPRLVNTLKAYYEGQGNPDPEVLVFPGRDGTPFDCYNLLRYRFYPLLKRAGVKRIRFHDLRHTYASLCIAAGMDGKALQQAMGHSSITVTLNTYAHLLPGTYDRPLARLEAMFSSGEKVVNLPMRRGGE